MADLAFETPLKAGVRAVLAERFGYTQREADVFIERATRDRLARSMITSASGSPPAEQW